MLPQDEYGQPELPKKAERIYGKPGKGDKIGHYLDRTFGRGEDHRLPDARRRRSPARPSKGGRAGPADDAEPRRR